MRHRIAIALGAGLLGGLLIVAPRATAQNRPSQNVIDRADLAVGATPLVLCPLNGSRVECGCTNNDATVNLRVGSSTITSTRGQRVPAGSSFKYTGAAALYGISEGASLTVSCTDETY